MHEPKRGPMMPKTSDKKVRDKGFEKESRTVVMSFKATPKERDIIERIANEEGVTVSQYIRGSIMSDLLLSGDMEAMKYSISLLGSNIKQAIREKVFIHERERKEEAYS